MPSPNYIDARTLDLSNQEHKNFIDNKILRHIQEGKLKLEPQIEVWKKYETYVEDKEIPANFTGDAATMLKNDPSQVLKDDNDEYYFSINKTREINNRTVAEFTKGDKTAIVEPDDPRNTKIAMNVQREIDNIEADQDIDATVREVCVEKMVNLGLHWSEVDYNSRKKSPVGLGKIEFEDVSAKDMLIDTKCEKKYFEDRRWDCRIKKVPYEEACRFLARFGIEHSRIVCDREYDFIHGMKEDDKDVSEEYVTLYFYQYKECYSLGYNYNENMMEAGSMQVGEDGKLSSSDIEEESDIFYRAVYNTSLGTVDHQVNELEQFTRTPYYNIKSETSFWPMADTYYLRRLNKLYDVINTVFVNYVRKLMKSPVALDEESYISFRTLIDQGLATGDYIPIKKGGKIENANFTKEVPGGFMQLLTHTYQALQEAGFSHDPIEGKYPTQGDLNASAINLLQIQALKPQSYKERHITYAVTQEARLVYKIMSLYYTQQHFIALQDAGNEKKNFIPMNTTWPLEEYLKFLQENKYELEKFEEENDVNYLYPKQTSSYEAFSMPDAMSKILVVINPMGEDADLKVRIKYDFDSKRNEQMKLAKAQMARKEGLIPDDDYLRALGFNNANEMLKKVEEKNEILQIGKTILEGGPELVQQVMQFVKRYNAINQMKKKLKPNPIENSMEQLAA